MPEQTRMPEQGKKEATISSPGSTADRGRAASLETPGKSSEVVKRANDPSGGSDLEYGEDGKLIRQVRATANDAYDAATTKATEKLEEQKTNLSSGLTTVADVVRRVGNDLETSKSDDKITRFTSEFSRAAAQRIERGANYFDQQDLNAVYDDVENLARQRPAVFIGGAFVFGFLAARFLKSSSPRHRTGGSGRPYSLPQDQPKGAREAARQGSY